MLAPSRVRSITPASHQQAEVAGEAGLRLAEDFGELHHAERAAGGERQQAQPGRLGAGAQGEEEGIHGG